MVACGEFDERPAQEENRHDTHENSDRHGPTRRAKSSTCEDEDAIPSAAIKKQPEPQRNETKLLLMELTIVRIVGLSPCCLEISNAHATTKPPATHVNAVTMVRWLGASVLASVSSHSSMVTSMSLTKVVPNKITEKRKTNAAKAHTHFPHAMNVRAAAGILEGVHGRRSATTRQLPDNPPAGFCMRYTR